MGTIGEVKIGEHLLWGEYIFKAISAHFPHERVDKRAKIERLRRKIGTTTRKGTDTCTDKQNKTVS